MNTLIVQLDFILFKKFIKAPGLSGNSNLYNNSTKFVLLISLIYISSSTGYKFSFDFIKEKNPQLLSGSYLPGYTSGITFFIAVAATNLFHQGNWQRIYAAKDYRTLKKSLITSFIVIVPIVFLMGFIGLVAFSIDSSI